MPLERRASLARGDGQDPSQHGKAKGVAPIPSGNHNPPAPRGLGYVGKREWHKIWQAGFWFHPDQDYHWVEMICRAYDDIHTFRERIEQDGLIVKGYNGQDAAHPLIAEIRKCEQTIRSCLTVLGFSPTDRARLGFAEAKARQEGVRLQDMINQGAK